MNNVSFGMSYSPLGRRSLDVERKLANPEKFFEKLEYKTLGKAVADSSLSKARRMLTSTQTAGEIAKNQFLAHQNMLNKLK